MNGRPGPEMREPFEAFYRRTWRDAVRWASALTGSVASGEDVAQEAFVRVSKRYDSVDRPDGYLRVTVVNVARDEHRSARRRRSREQRMAGGEQSAEPAVRSGLLGAVVRLPYEQRAALVLRYWADWDEATIAEALGCRPATVRSHAKRGLDTLRASTTTWEDDR